jgi:pyruvate/2-oxoglutarate dehydrogenase complex dihydrolipoamide dehydrogenase (E3) component
VTAVVGPAVGVVVVGGGAAGLAAATTAAAGGVAVTLVSDGPLGGDCTWHGCVPTKALLEAAAAGLDATGAVAHARSVVARVARTESASVLEGVGVEVVRSRARLRPTDAGVQVVLGDGSLLAPDLGVVLATGSRPRGATGVGLPDPLPADCRVVTTDGWLDGLTAHLAAGDGDPGPVVVVGGGASGTELAQALARLGVAGDRPVLLLERTPGLLPGLAGAGAVVERSLREDGVEVVTGPGAESMASRVGPGTLVLLAAGREPVLDVLGPARDAVATTAAGIVVDPAMRTSLAGVVAAGDVTGLQPSTHVAAATGRVAAATLLGRDVGFDATWAPRVVYTDPEVAAVGQVPGPPGTRELRVPVSRTDRALLASLPDGRSRYRSRGGFAQVWVGPEADGGTAHGGRFVGALVVGPHAGELVSEIALAGRLGLTVEQWSGGVSGIGAVSAGRAYPTWSWWWDAVADGLLGR